jgi:cytidylate kinase
MIGAFERAKRYIVSQSEEAEEGRKFDVPRGPCITISRETGAGAALLGEALIKFFEPYTKPGSPEWALFDRNLIERVLKDHNLPMSLSLIMEEEKYPSIQTMVSELLGKHPDTWALIRRTTETILKLAHVGNVIIIGRGSNIITARLNNVFHVRLVSEMSDKIKHIMKTHNLNREEAIKYIEKDDIGRKSYLKNYFHKDIDNPSLYHLVINTHAIPHEEAAEIIGRAVLRKYPRLFVNLPG